ncbi:hypothetical protein [Microvirga roseola]|uniref:hypothetical protein n=1 Tax=Microvirga roseola TaxID=2883126 RepID=UPI001E3276F9|nr:hypothetical protein [Microvirga roseola]
MKMLLIASAAKMSLALLFPAAVLKGREPARDAEDDPLLPFPGIWDRAPEITRKPGRMWAYRGSF